MIRERENQDENRLLAGIETRSRQIEEGRKEESQKPCDDKLARKNAEVSQGELAESSEDRSLLPRSRVGPEDTADASADATAVPAADGQGAAIDGENRLQLHQGHDEPWKKEIYQGCLIRDEVMSDWEASKRSDHDDLPAESLPWYAAGDTAASGARDPTKFMVRTSRRKLLKFRQSDLSP